MSFSLATSVVFYSGYAKHVAMTTLFVALVIWQLATWSDQTSVHRAALVGIVMGAATGVGWPIVAMPAVVLVAVVLTQRQWRMVGVIAGSAVLAAIATGVLVMARAAAGPPVNWGDARDVARLWDLWTLADYGTLDPASDPAASGSWLGDLPLYLRVLVSSLGVPSFVLAAVAVALAWSSHVVLRSGAVVEARHG